MAGEAERLTAALAIAASTLSGASSVSDAHVNGKIKIGISACLLGNAVRYDGGHRHDRYITGTLGRWFEFVPICPEVEAGFSIPREPLELKGSARQPRLIVRGSTIDVTGVLVAWAKQKVRSLAGEGLAGYIFKTRSPSCAVDDAAMLTPAGRRSGPGLFRAMVGQVFPVMPVTDETALADPVLRENFIGRVFVYRRWLDLTASRLTVGKLVSFHADHKLLVMAHSVTHYIELGRLVASAKSRPLREVADEYLALLLEGLRHIATPKKNANVLHHIMGYFKRVLTPENKRELLAASEAYRNELLPLVVPLVLINHHLKRHPDPYLVRQVYLRLHPSELMPRNPV
jgi:uncharacterized protein YbgA (DUF1722 family)/uncharacterized protein YbbK (DUF523 family)